MSLMVRTLTGFEPAPAHLANVLGPMDKIVVGGEDWRYRHPVLGSHVAKTATIICAGAGLGAAFVIVSLDSDPSVSFGMRREDMIRQV